MKLQAAPYNRPEQQRGPGGRAADFRQATSFRYLDLSEFAFFHPA